MLADSFKSWRAAARILIVRCQPPESVEWLSSTGREDGGLLAALAQPWSGAAEAPPLRLPRALVEMPHDAACFRADDRWAFLYRVPWRWQQGQREVMTMADDDGGRLHRMVKAVRREEHAMPAWRRFIAGFEPAHDVRPPVAQHFANCMGRAAFTIAAEDAQPQRQQPHTLDECRRCDLWQHATQAVPGEGAKRARIMLVGEQPGDQEDLQGHPFVGPAGHLLDKALEQAGVDRAKVYLTNAVKHFKWEPRGKRRLHKTPAQKEVAACHYWLEAELAKVRPDVVVALGGTALKSVLEDGRARLKDFIDAPVRHGKYQVVATYHPAFILRVPDDDTRARAMEALVHALRTALELSLSSA